MIEIKREFNNGLFDCCEIYDLNFKILEKSNNFLWNTNEDNPICIPKSRIEDYEESNIPSEEIFEENF